MKQLVSSFLLAISCASCANLPPVWRSADVEPSNPIPTLAAASNFAYIVPDSTIDLTGVSLDTVALAAEVDPEGLMNAVAEAASEFERDKVLAQAVGSASAGMAEQVLALLSSQGFEIEIDPARSGALRGGGMGSGDDGNPDSGMVGNVFGGENGQIPMFGPGSKSDLANRLRSGRNREAYASIHAAFSSPASRPENGMTCSLTVIVLDQDGEFLFEGRASGHTPGGTSGADAAIRQAFDAALAQVAQPAVIVAE